MSGDGGYDGGGSYGGGSYDGGSSSYHYHGGNDTGGSSHHYHGGGYDSGSSSHHHHHGGGGAHNSCTDDSNTTQTALGLLLGANMLSSSGFEPQEKEKTQRDHQDTQRRVVIQRREQANNDRRRTYAIHFAQGIQQVHDKNIQVALTSFDQALLIFPDSFEAKYYSAICFKMLGEFKVAYDKFLKLVGRSDATLDAQEQVLICEAQLLEIGTQSLQAAKQAFELKELDEALRHISKVRENFPSDSVNGKIIRASANELEKQIIWDKMRGVISNQTERAKNALLAKQYVQALDMLKKCEADFMQNQNLFTEADNLAYAELKKLVVQASDFCLQSKINMLLKDLQKLVANFRLDKAIPVCREMVANCKKISNPKSVESLGYLSEAKIVETSQELQRLAINFTRCESNFIADVKSGLKTKFLEKRITLPDHHLERLSRYIDYALQNENTNFDENNMRQLQDAIIQKILSHLKKYNLLIGCFKGSSHYLIAEGLSLELKDIVLHNIALNKRPAIELDIFKPKDVAQIEAPPAILYSDAANGTTETSGADIVSNTVGTESLIAVANKSLHPSLQ